MKRLLLLSFCLAACGGSTSESGPSGANVFYLNFEGQTLVPGPDDPAANVSALPNQQSTLSPYLGNDPDRALKIRAIVSEVKTLLAPFDIKVVTSRPASGSYDMTVVGGAPTQVGLSNGVLAAAVPDCAGARPRHVALVFDDATGHEAARQIVGGLGLGHAVSASTQANDCMCVVSGTCTTLATACTLGGAGTPVDANASCEAQGVTTMDVKQEFTVAFGAHP